MAKKALIILSRGFEDIEAVAPIDILTRLGVEVTIASLTPGPVDGAYGCTLVPDTELSKVEGDFDAVILPGGKVNATALAADSRLVACVQRHLHKHRIVAAICASPSLVLGEAADIIRGRHVTGDPAFNSRLEACGGILTHKAVSSDNTLITAQGPGAAIEFGFHIALQLVEKTSVHDLAKRWRLHL